MECGKSSRTPPGRFKLEKYSVDVTDYRKEMIGAIFMTLKVLYSIKLLPILSIFSRERKDTSGSIEIVLPLIPHIVIVRTFTTIV